MKSILLEHLACKASQEPSAHKIELMEYKVNKFISKELEFIKVPAETCDSFGDDKKEGGKSEHSLSVEQNESVGNMIY